MITTTLNRIKKHRPYQDVWERLLNDLGKKKADGEPLSFATILEINGLDDALWCCRVEPQYAREWRLFAVTCARRVEYLNPDPRVKSAIDVAERYANGQATDEELRVAANAAAWDAAWYAALDAARDSAWDAAWAARDAARDAARNAAWAAAWVAARNAAGAAAWTAAGDAAWTAAEAAEREWQKQEFLRVVIETE